jgi:hypothetical protein
VEIGWSKDKNQHCKTRGKWEARKLKPVWVTLDCVIKMAKGGYW